MQPFKYESKARNNRLNNRIEVWGNTEYTNKLNEKSYRFQKIKEIWASIIPQTGKLQTQQAETVLTNVTHKVIVRHSAGKDIDKNMEFVFKGRKFKIKFILNPFEENEVFEIFCEEVMR